MKVKRMKKNQSKKKKLEKVMKDSDLKIGRGNRRERKEEKRENRKKERKWRKRLEKEASLQDHVQDQTVKIKNQSI